MKIAVTDTETSGLPLFNDPSEDPRQPHICEVATFLFDTDTKTVIEKFHAIIKQEGWTVEPEAFAAHGITPERSMTEGIDEREAFYLNMRLLEKADLIVAHNWQFDQRIYRIGLKRFGNGSTSLCDTDQLIKDADADAFKARPSYCTMKTLTPIMALPATEKMRASGRGSWKKQPSLAEAHNYCFGEMFEGAHSALADAWACARVYFWVTQKHDIGKLAP